MTTRLAVRQSTLADVFDPRANSLNALRLVLATGVIVWHSFPLTGADIGFAPLRQLLSNGWVDGFFAVSGFLIVSSWVRRPDWWQFLRARLLRILPAFYACLLVTAFVLAPLALLVAGAGYPPGFWADAWGYVVHNGALRVTQYDIAGTPLDVPYPGVWNGSLWTLWWEFLCYLGVLALGVSGLLRRRWCIPVVFALCLVGVAVTSYGSVDNFYLNSLSRFGVMFAAGALVFQFQHRLQARWSHVIVSGVIVLAASVLPDYRIIAALPLAYLLIAIGALVKNRIFWLRNDISYGIYIYAFPLQQCLAILGLAAIGVPAFAALSIVATVPMALASWFFVEKPALRLRRRPGPQSS
ncbi:MAG: acyltransferase [Mycetocola sp.]